MSVLLARLFLVAATAVSIGQALGALFVNDVAWATFYLVLAIFWVVLRLTIRFEEINRAAVK